VLRHYIELLLHYRAPIIRFVVIVPLIVLAMSVGMRIISPNYTAYAIVSMSPTRVELAYTDAWAKQNFASPVGISTQTVIEYLNSTPVMEIALDKILERLSGSVEAAPANRLVDAFDRGMKLLAGSIWRLYYTLDRGMFVEPTDRELRLFALKKGAEVEAVTGTFLLRIEVSHEQPIIASIAANALADAYVERASSIAAAEAEALRKALQAEAAQLDEELTKLDRERPKILQSRGPEGVEVFERQIQRVEEDLRTARTRLLSVDLEAANLNNEIQVIEPATVPVYPSSPRMLIYFLAAIFGSVLMACVGLITSDLIGEKIITSFDLKRMVKGRFLGVSVEPPRFIKIPLLKRIWNNWWVNDSMMRLARSASIKGFLDAPNLYFVGFLSMDEAAAAADSVREAVSRIVELEEVRDKATVSGAGGEGRVSDNAMPRVPELAMLPALSAGFHWGGVASAGPGFVVFCIPSGAASYDDVDEIVKGAEQVALLKPLFFLVNARKRPGRKRFGRR